jgi:hypothetical protein
VMREETPPELDALATEPDALTSLDDAVTY